MKLNFKTLIFFLAAIIFLLTAYYSVGYFHADEHYQVIELAGLKAGWNDPRDLAWEYHAKIRSSLLPVLAYIVFKINALFQIKDIYTSLFILRLVSGLMSFSSLAFFFKKSRVLLFKSSQSESFLQYTYLALLLLSWYIPFLSVRFSSETWAAICLLFALGFYFEIGKTNYHAFIVGLLLGLSFLFRFQMAFGFIGIGAFHLIFGIQKLKTTLLILIGFSGILLLGVFIDRWFYSEWTFTPWNYFWLFFENDILNQNESSFGMSTRFYYLETCYQLPTQFIGAILIISLAAGIIINRKNPIVWFIVPFILIHSLISHKEERFLFPILFLFPYLIISTFLFLKNNGGKFKKINKIVVYCTIAGLFFVNSCGLSVMTTKSAGLGRSEITKYIHHYYGTQKINLIHTPFANPYDPWGTLPEKAYSEKHLESQQIDNLGNLSDTLIKANRVNLIVVRGYDLTNNTSPGNLEAMGFQLKGQSISEREKSLNYYVKGFDNQDILYLYEYIEK